MRAFDRHIADAQAGLKSERRRMDCPKQKTYRHIINRMRAAIMRWRVPAN